MFSNIFDKWELLGGSIGESRWFRFIASTSQMVETENERKESQAEKVPSSFIFCVPFATFFDQLI